MAGKASLLLVMGFSMIFLVFGHNFNTLSTRTVDNFTEYYSKTVAHDLAVSGANIAANEIFLDGTWTTGYNDLQLNGGEIDVKVDIIDASQNIRKITSEAKYGDDEHKVEVVLAPSRFSKFAYFSEIEGSNIWWMGKDTVFGPFHTQDNLRVDNHPVFGVVGYRTTIKGKLIYKDYKNQDKPIFHGSFEDGVDEPLQTNGLDPMRQAAEDNGMKIDYSTSEHTVTEWVDGKWVYDHGWQWVEAHWETNIVTAPDTAYITFVNDSVKIKMGYNKPETTYKTSEVAKDNKVIYAEGMDIRLKGTVEGRFSVLSDGNIYLDDDIVYKTDPRTNPNSTDLLGILAQEKVLITDNDETKNINIHGAIYCQDGGFGAENYDTRSKDGEINLLGGMTQHKRQAVGTFDSAKDEVKTGFSKKYRYDPRLMVLSPPFFPTTQGFSIVSWKE